VTSRELLALAAVGLPLLSGTLIVLLPRRCALPLALGAAGPTAAAGLALAALTIPRTDAVTAGGWVVFDAPGGVLLAVISVVGAVSVLVSRAHLGVAGSALVPSALRERAYYGALYAFWGVLMAVPLAGNLGAAWLAVEATTAASAQAATSRTFSRGLPIVSPKTRRVFSSTCAARSSGLSASTNRTSIPYCGSVCANRL